MKKILSFIFTLTFFLTTLSSCSSDDNSNSNSNSNSEILGTWGTEWDNGNGIAVHPKFTFLSNGKVKYYTYFDMNNPELEEIGTWSLSENILTMNFPETVELRYKNRITIVNSNQIDFEEIEVSGFDSWSTETYFKTEDPNLN